MNNQEKQLLAMVNGESDSFDTMLGQGADNPNFIAQFDLQLLTNYFTVTGGVYTPILPAALNAGLQNDLPFFLFGQSDYESGYAKLVQQFQINANWTFGAPFIFGKDNPAIALDANATGVLQKGDLVLPYTSDLPGGGTTTVALLVVRCSNIAMGSLLQATSSDTFIINGVRYVLDDPTTNAQQYSKAINVFELSIFGKFDSDSFTPNAYKVPEQFQNGIVDLPITKGIDKHKSIAFPNLYTNVSQSMSIFVQTVDKLTAGGQAMLR